MSNPFLAEIRAVAFTFAPRGWAFCNGQVLPIKQNQALFSLLGTTYGGDGITTFALPDLRARTPLHASATHPLGQAAGASTHTLTVAELPAHAHVATARVQAGDNPSPAGRLWGTQPDAQTYAAGSPTLVAMSPQAVTPAGGGQPHENTSPYLALNFVIALQGIFPSRS
jgi:microcystin-dependent protein